MDANGPGWTDLKAGPGRTRDSCMVAGGSESPKLRLLPIAQFCLCVPCRDSRDRACPLHRPRGLRPPTGFLSTRPLDATLRFAGPRSLTTHRTFVQNDDEMSTAGVPRTAHMRRAPR